MGEDLFRASGVKKGSEWRAIKERESRPLLATKIPILDHMGGKGLARGTLIELCGGPSSGQFAIALAILAAATGAGESAALVDPGAHLDPQGAAAAGIDLSRLLWVRPPHLKEALMSTEMILSTGFSLVVLDLALQPSSPFPNAVWLRLSRAAVAQKSVLLVITLHPLCSTAADIVVMAESARPLWFGNGRMPKLLAGLSVDLTARHRRGGRGALSGRVILSVYGKAASEMPEERTADGIASDCLPLHS
jgi:hypothetical protein